MTASTLPSSGQATSARVPSALRRIAAYFLDGLIFSPIYLVTRLTLGPWTEPMVDLCFTIYLIIGNLGVQTLGRRALGVAVVSRDGTSELPVWRATLRELPNAVFYAGNFLFGAATQRASLQHQLTWNLSLGLFEFCYLLVDFGPVMLGGSLALHDRISGSVVRRTK